VLILRGSLVQEAVPPPDDVAMRRLVEVVILRLGEGGGGQNRVMNNEQKLLHAKQSIPTDPHDVFLQVLQHTLHALHLAYDLLHLC
jgi:hypothetical protein